MYRTATAGGFTLVELMITVAVIAVGLTFAVPAFTNFIRNNQMISQSNDFLVSLTFARSEALKRGRPTAVCATDDPAATPPSCSGNGAGWENGWLVFVDDDTAGTDGDYDNATEALLRVPDSETVEERVKGVRLACKARFYGREGRDSSVRGKKRVTLFGRPCNHNVHLFGARLEQVQETVRRDSGHVTCHREHPRCARPPEARFQSGDRPRFGILIPEVSDVVGKNIGVRRLVNPDTYNDGLSDLRQSPIDASDHRRSPNGMPRFVAPEPAALSTSHYQTGNGSILLRQHFPLGILQGCYFGRRSLQEMRQAILEGDRTSTIWSGSTRRLRAGIPGLFQRGCASANFRFRSVHRGQWQLSSSTFRPALVEGQHGFRAPCTGPPPRARRPGSQGHIGAPRRSRAAARTQPPPTPRAGPRPTGPREYESSFLSVAPS